MQIESFIQKYRENHIILTYIQYVYIKKKQKKHVMPEQVVQTTIHINLADQIFKQTFIVDYWKVSKIYNLLVTCSLH